ncbi:MAG: 4Fe-4S binding protein [Gammaproteobacteria bacterium]|nr:4Fe-4S binding protein [Gammaproteobacteria bacterium]
MCVCIPIVNRPPDYSALQKKRRWSQAGFFALFIFAPVLNIFRLDLNLGHFILFGYDWTLGLEAFVSGQASSVEAAFNIFVRGFLPIVIVFGGGAWIAWKYGRFYCGWLCPHFSVVEMINGLMRRTFSKLSIWDKQKVSALNPDGTQVPASKWNSFLLGTAVLGFAFLWAVVLLTYLLPPKEIYSNLFNAELTHNQFVFISVGTLALFIEFMFARHLFCRFACAIGFFQSVLWMANKKALVVGLDRSRVSDCSSCNAACEQVCPMRLKPRSIKRKMFTCTECAQCLAACEQVQAGGIGNAGKIQTPLLQWIDGECALDVSKRDFGQRPDVPASCFNGQVYRTIKSKS